MTLSWTIHLSTTGRHLIMGSYCVTYHPTQVNRGRYNSSYLPRRDGRLSCQTTCTKNECFLRSKQFLCFTIVTVFWTIFRISRSGRVEFDCVRFEEDSLPGYCFTYVSTANSGAVTEHISLCLPTVYQPGNQRYTNFEKNTFCGTRCLSHPIAAGCTVIEIFSLIIIGVATSTSQGPLKSSVTWPFVYGTSCGSAKKYSNCCMQITHKTQWKKNGRSTSVLAIWCESAKIVKLKWQRTVS